MDPQVARKVLDATAKIKTVPTGAVAKRILLSWFRALDLEEDRWGNFHEKDGTRWHFKQKVVNQQSKIGGTWRNIWSKSLIDASIGVMLAAVKSAGTPEEKERVNAILAKRKGGKVKVKKAREAKRFEKESRVIAMKSFAHDYPMPYFLNSLGVSIPEDLLLEMRDKVTEYTTIAEGRLSMGDKPVDAEFASVDDPPLPPLFTSLAPYNWREKSDGVLYSIQVLNHEYTKASIHIGRPTEGTMMFLEPWTGRISMKPMPDIAGIGDAYAAGKVWVDVEQKMVMGSLTFLLAQEPGKGAGSRVLDLWCRMMTGYGASGFLVEAPLPEGREFIQRKVWAGELGEIAEWEGWPVVDCGFGRKAAAKVRADELWGRAE